MKYSKASSLSPLISLRSRPSKTRLVGSILYLDSTMVDVEPHGYEAILLGERDSSTGPTTNDGHIIDSAFSRCIVNKRVAPVCSDSSEDDADVILEALLIARGETGCEVVKRPRRR